MAILSKALYGLNVTPIKLLMKFFTELEQIIQTFIWNQRRPRIVKSGSKNRQEKEQSRRYNSFRRQAMLQSYSNQIVWYWYKNRHSDQQNRIESPEVNHTLMVN